MSPRSRSISAAAAVAAAAALALSGCGTLSGHAEASASAGSSAAPSVRSTAASASLISQNGKIPVPNYWAAPDRDAAERKSAEAQSSAEAEATQAPGTQTYTAPEYSRKILWSAQDQAGLATIPKHRFMGQLVAQLNCTGTGSVTITAYDNVNQEINRSETVDCAAMKGPNGYAAGALSLDLNGGSAYINIEAPASVQWSAVVADVTGLPEGETGWDVDAVIQAGPEPVQPTTLPVPLGDDGSATSNKRHWSVQDTRISQSSPKIITKEQYTASFSCTGVGTATLTLSDGSSATVDCTTRKGAPSSSLGIMGRGDGKTPLSFSVSAPGGVMWSASFTENIGAAPLPQTEQ